MNSNGKLSMNQRCDFFIKIFVPTFHKQNRKSWNQNNTFFTQIKMALCQNLNERMSGQQMAILFSDLADIPHF